MKFYSSNFNEYCDEKNITIIHSKPRHPQMTIVERLLKDILNSSGWFCKVFTFKKSLYVEKLIKQEKYNSKLLYKIRFLVIIIQYAVQLNLNQ